MRWRTLLLIALILFLISLAFYTLVPTDLEATYSSSGILNGVSVLSGEGEARVDFGDMLSFNVRRNGNLVTASVLPSELSPGFIKLTLQPPRGGSIYWRVEPPCEVPVKVYSQDGSYVLEADGLGDCGSGEVSMVLLTADFPLRLSLETTGRKGLRVYRARWTFLVGE
ncbi:hypothetical protein [Thermococcus zilligii]|uniref:hypothetical protein n=1 Tax=Thermococcus zilligii TaxID=54076 RepID=UPI0012F74168|nr:hypothetical protein [Thermococcus zilligii]